VKTFHDAEALVVGHETGKGRHGDRMGALYVRFFDGFSTCPTMLTWVCVPIHFAKCQLPDGKKFKVGTGFTDAQRDNPPKIGAVITFRSRLSLALAALPLFSFVHHDCHGIIVWDRYQELSPAGIPRFPGFVRVRTDVKWPPDSPWPPAK
jgi:DNA ligase 1